MTPERIAELRRLCEAATPGPWVAATWAGEDFGWSACGPVHEESDDDTPEGPNQDLAKRDADFMSAARIAVPELLDEVERLRKEVDIARDVAGHAFVAGASWWQSAKCGATPFPFERDEMEVVAAQQYPFPPHPIVVERDSRITELGTKVERLTGLLREVAGSGVEFEASGYFTVQIDTDTWNELQALRPKEGA